MSQPHIASSHHPQQGVGKLPDRVADALAEAVSELRFGLIQLTVHEGKVVQLDVTERQRF